MSTKYIASNWRLPNEENSNKSDNYGLTFDGTELIDCGADTNLDLNNSFSISTWIKFTSTSSMVVLAKREATKISLLIELGSGKPFTAIRDASSNIAITNTYSGTYNDGNWHHIVATFDRTANELKLYVDNELKETANTSSVGDIAPTTNNLMIGRRSDTSSSFFTGSISECAIFNYPLSSTQISTLYGSSSLGAGNPMALKPQPVAYYPLGDNSASNPLTQPNEAVEDASVFDFSGSNQWIDCGIDSSIDTGNLSVAFWFNKDSSASGFQYVFNSGSGSAKAGFVFAFSGTNIYIGRKTRTHTAGFTTYTNIGISADKWHHIALTYNDTSNNFIAYLDGQSVHSSTGTTATNAASSEIIFGRISNVASAYYKGKVSNAQIWTTELSSSEVTTLYNSGVPLTGTQPQASNLRAWYKLDQSANWDVSGSGYWDIPDASGNGNDGISSGMTSANLVLTDLTRNLPYDSYSFNFDGVNDRISINEIQFTGEFTLSMWINPEAISAGNTFILGRWNNNFDNDIKLSLSNNTPVITLRIGGAGVVFYGYTTSSTIPLNEWSHLLLIRNSSNDINCYLNGVQFSTTTGSSTNTLTLDSIGRVINDSYGWNGKISNISFFSAALTSTEIMKLYSNGVPQDLSNFTPAPVAWWTLGSNSFFNGSNFICKDLIGSNDGTSVNAGVDALQGNTPRSEANGTGTNMDIPTNLEGQTKYSSNNSWSINMSESARVADTP